MPQTFTIILGKAVRYAARLRGGGSALPGLFVEKISPNFVPNILNQLPMGVVIVSGTNGKTTTTKMVVSLLESQGLKVFTNRTGSNFVRGVAAALLGDVNNKGELQADIAVLELDEAHAVKFVEVIKPTYSLLLNVMRDQLDRFGEIDSTARMLEKVALATSKAVIMNREDSRVSLIANKIPKSIESHFFGLNDKLLSHFPSDDNLHGDTSSAPTVNNATPTPTANVILQDFNDTSATFTINNKSYTTNLKIKGVYNIYNSAAALALVKAVLPNAPNTKLVDALSKVTPAFGRGETIILNGQPLDLVLVKNPGGFRLGLKSYNPVGYKTMIAINDNYADGRDMSWLWDVDFRCFKKIDMVSGIRAYDMALRLQYDEVVVQQVDTDLSNALKQFLSGSAKHRRIFCTYTAMMQLRKQLAKKYHVEAIDE